MKQHKIKLATMDFEGNSQCEIEVTAGVDPLLPKLNNLDLNNKFKAIKLLISSIDMKHDCNEDYVMFQKIMLSILDEVGQTLKNESCIDDHRNLQSVKYLVDAAFKDDYFSNKAFEGVFDQEEEE